MMGFSGDKGAALSSRLSQVKGGRALALGGRLLREMGAGVLQLAWPAQCLACPALVAEEGGLCPACWREAGFISGLACEACGEALAGQAGAGPEYCDACLAAPRPWGRGRAVMGYEGAGRRIALGLKHQRFDLMPAAGRWLARAAAPLLRADSVVAPVPLHWSRLLARRYNQAAMLAQALAKASGARCCPDLLQRHRATGTQEGRSRSARLAAMEGAFRAHPRRLRWLEGRHVLLVDDVMTTGATLAASALACLEAGADAVDVVVLARAGLRGE